MASIEGFVELINDRIERPFIIIPSHSFNILPNRPFATWSQTTEPEQEIMFRHDGRVENDIDRIATETSTFYEMVTVNFKIYADSKSEANLRRNELIHLIKFKSRYELNYEGYGIIEVSKLGETPEKLETGEYLQCYPLDVRIDFNNEVEREQPYLDTIEVDINSEDVETEDLEVIIDLT